MSQIAANTYETTPARKEAFLGLGGKGDLNGDGLADVIVFFTPALGLRHSGLTLAAFKVANPVSMRRQRQYREPCGFSP